MNKQSVTLKLLIVGDSGVGKTSLLMRYTENKFHTDFLSTIGVDFKVKKIQTETHQVTLNIWDTAGQQRFRNITKTFYKGAHGVILVYSITDNKSFQHLASWIHQVKDNGSDKANMILVGSKSDMQNQRQVSQKLGKEIATKFNIEFIETSAKDNENIDRVFQHLVRNIIRELKEGQTMNNNSQKIKGKKLKKSKEDKKNKDKCC